MRSPQPVMPAVIRLAAALGGFLLPVLAYAQLDNGSAISVPTLDGIGLASLAGVLTMSGAWLIARRRSRKN